MNIFSWIILGAIAGWIASMIMGRNQQMGAIANIICGIVGAFVGGIITERIFNVKVDGFNLTSFIVAIFGAVIVLAIYNFFSKNKR